MIERHLLLQAPRRTKHRIHRTAHDPDWLVELLSRRQLQVFDSRVAVEACRSGRLFPDGVDPAARAGHVAVVLLPVLLAVPLVRAGRRAHPHASQGLVPVSRVVTLQVLLRMLLQPVGSI